MNNSKSTGFVPQKLNAAHDMLLEFTKNAENAFADAMCNQTAASYHLIQERIDSMRKALKQLEMIAQETLQSEVTYHRERLAEIEALGVL